MHQPSYRASDGEYRQPWVYLHAIKDYTDMAWHLEQVPAARATVSFAPVLLDQLDDYGAQFESRTFRDSLLRALQRGDADAPDQRRQLAYMLCRANYERIVRRFPAFERLFHLAEAEAWGGQPLSEQDRADTIVWYHLAWLGEGARRSDARVHDLMSKAGGFDAADRDLMLDIVGGLVRGIVERYRRLAHAGRIELAMSPYSHPIMPLLIDFAAARESRPNVPLPAASYPGGERRVTDQLKAGVNAHAARFGSSPRGCWPSEGGISERTIAALCARRFAWTASGELVLANSLRASSRGADPGRREGYLYTPYAVHTETGTIACFFRDDDLSDRVGFIYAPWKADDAVADLVSALEGIAQQQDGRARVVSIILDGENAWEHYADNACEFLSTLYQRLSSNEALSLTTFAGHLAHTPALPSLERVVAGSWVYGTFETWVGEPDKNRGWDLLCAAKRAYDETLAAGTLDEAGRTVALQCLRRCESSDWFWWFGGYNPPAPVRDFDGLYRRHLRDLYAALGRAAPPELDVPVSIGTGEQVYDGVMRRATEPEVQ